MALSDNLRGAIYMNVAMAAFTVNDAAMKQVTADLPLFQTIAMRGLLTVLALAVLVRVMAGGRFSVPRGDRGPVAWRAVAEFAATITFIAALTHMPLPNVSALFQALPLAMTLAAALFLGERVGWRRLAAIGAGAVGVLMIVQPGMAGFDIWSLVVLASVAAVVVRDLATRRVAPSVHTATVAFWTSVCLTLTCAVIALWQGLRWPAPGTLALIVFAAAFLTLGYVTVITASRTGDVGFVAPHRYAALIWALVLGFAVFGDWPDALTLTGAAVVVASGIFTIWRESRLRRNPARGRVDIPGDSA